MQNPELLLVDEPVAGMTPQEIERTSELLLSLRASTPSWLSSMIWPSCDRLPGASPCCTKDTSSRRGDMDKVQNDPRVREVYLGV